MEYEYSFKVDSLDKYIDFCITNNYKKIEENNEIRTLYKKEDKTMARVTKKEANKNIKIFLDFKDDVLTDDILIERKETLPLEIKDEEAVDSILNYLNYKLDKVLNRTRIIYKKDNVVFELDNYILPDKMYVVAVEGKKEEVDIVYNEIKNL